MALYFNIATQWREVEKLQDELRKLQDRLKEMRAMKAPLEDIDSVSGKIVSVQEKVRSLTEGMYNSALASEELMRKVGDNDKAMQSISSLKTEVTQYQNAINEAQKAVVELSEKQAELSNRKAEASTNISMLQGRKANFTSALSDVGNKGEQAADNGDDVAFEQMMQAQAQLKTAIANTNAEIEAAKQKEAEYDTQIQATSEKIAEQNTQISNYASGLSNAKERYTEMVGAFATGTETTMFKDLGDGVARAKQELEDAKAGLAGYQDSLKACKEKGDQAGVEELTAKIKKQEAAVAEATENYNGAKAVLDNYKASVEQIKTSLDTLGQSIDAEVAKCTSAKEIGGQLAATWETMQQVIAGVSADNEKSASSFDALMAKSNGYKATVEQCTQAQVVFGQSKDEAMRKTASEQGRTALLEYKSALEQAAQAAQTAFSSQQEVVAALEARLQGMKDAMQQALTAGDTGAAAEYQQNISLVSTAISSANTKLVEYEKKVSQVSTALEAASEVEEQFVSASKLRYTALQTAWEGTTIIVERAAEKVADGVTNVFKPVEEKVEAAVVYVSEKIQSLGTAIANSGVGQAAQKFGSEFGQNIQVAADHLKDFDEKIGDFLTGHGKFQASMRDSSKIFADMLPTSFRKAAVGAKALTLQFWKMAATPLGAVITALVAAFMALKTWMTGSAEGQKVLQKGTAALNSVLSSLKDMVIVVGEWLFKSFKEPIKAVVSLAGSIVKVLGTAVKITFTSFRALGTVIKGVFSGDWDTVKEGVSLYIGNFKNLGTLVSDIADTGKKALNVVMDTAKGVGKAFSSSGEMASKVSASFQQMGDKARQAMSLRSQETETTIAQANAMHDQLATQEKINKLRSEVYSKEGQDKIDALRELKKMQEGLYKGYTDANSVYHKGKLEFTKQLNEVAQAKLGLHTATMEEIARARNASLAVAQEQARAAAQTRFTDRMLASELRKQKKAEEKKAEEKKAKQTTAKGNKNNGEDLAKAEYENAQLIDKNAEARAKAQMKMEDTLTDMRIANIQDNGRKVIEEKKRREQKEIEQIAAACDEAIKAEIERQKKEYEAQQKIVKAKGGKVSYWDDGMADAEEIEKIKKQYEEQSRLTSEKYKLEELRGNEEAMRTYLAKYGTFEQQKLAITQEYERKIAEAQALGNEGQVLSLKAEQSSKLQAVDTRAIQAKIDWQSVFGDLTGVLEEQLRDLLNQLRDYTKTADFAKSSAEDKKTIYDAIQRIQEQTHGGEGTTNLAQLNQQMRDLGAAVTRAQVAEQQRIAAFNDLQAAEEAHKYALANLTTAEQQLAQQDLETARIAYQAAADYSTAMDAEMQNLSQSTRAAVQDTKQGLESVASGLQSLASGSLKGAFEGIKNTLGGLDKLNLPGKLGDTVGKMCKTLDNLPLAGAILEILDILKDGFSTIIATLIDTVMNAATGIIGDVLSGGMIKNVGGSLVNGLQNLGGTLAKGLTFGAVKFGGPDNSMYNEALDYWGGRLEYWGKAVDRYTEQISKGYGAESYESAKKALALNEAMITGQKNILDMRSDAGAGKGSHSYGYRMWNQGGYGAWGEVAGEISRKYGKRFEGIDDLANFTSDELREIQTQYADRWSRLDGAFKENLEKLIEMKDKTDEISDSLKQALTGTSFDSFRDSFLDTLSDMEKGADDLTKDFGDSLRKSILNATLSNLYSDRIKKLYDSWAKVFDTGSPDAALAEQVRAQQEQLAQEMAASRDSIAKSMGSWATADAQSATSKGVATITEQSAEELNGRFTALQMIGEQIRAQNADQTAQMNLINSTIQEIKAVGSSRNNIADETRAILANSYLELKDINANTEKTAKLLFTIDENISEVKRNTARI